MRVERYQEDDMRKAMVKVREELGNDAVLISSRRVDGRTEVTAASEYDPEHMEAQLKKYAESRSPAGNEGSSRDFLFEMMSESSETVGNSAPSLISMQEELAKLRKLFEGELAQLTWREAGNRQPNRMALLARLEEIGISRVIGVMLMGKVLPCSDLEIGWTKTLSLLGKLIKRPQKNVLEEGGVIALLGPTGVGKTTTAAKIAAQFALRHGRNQVAFITTDVIRVGGSEQLISLGSALGIPVQVAATREELERTLDSFSNRKLVIIDTTGINQRDAGLVEQFESLTHNDVSIDPYLVLPATSQESVISETIRAFSGIKLAGGIVTKVDENGSIGAVLSGLIRHRLPAAFIGNGQNIPEDLVPAQVGVFIRKLKESFYESEEQQSRIGNSNNHKKAINA